MKKFLALTIIISILISVFPAAGYATGNSVEGLYKDGMEYYEKRDYDSAIARFRVAGEARGYAPAQNMLGICYRDGLGTEQNLSEAERYFRLAADQGYSDAVNNFNALNEKKEEEYQKAITLYLNGNYDEATVVFKALDGYSQSEDFLHAIAVQTQGQELLPEPSAPSVSETILPSPILPEQQTEAAKCVKVSASWVHTVYLMSDGTVRSTKSDTYGQFPVSDWSDIQDISAGMQHVLGLKKDGTVVAGGSNRVKALCFS